MAARYVVIDAQMAVDVLRLRPAYVPKVFPHALEVLTDQIVAVPLRFFGFEVRVVEFDDLVEQVFISCSFLKLDLCGRFLPGEPRESLLDELQLAAALVGDFDELELRAGDQRVIGVQHAVPDEEAVFDGVEDALA